MNGQGSSKGGKGYPGPTRGTNATVTRNKWPLYSNTSRALSHASTAAWLRW